MLKNVKILLATHGPSTTINIFRGKVYKHFLKIGPQEILKLFI